MAMFSWKLLRMLELAVYATCIAVSFWQIPSVFSAQWRKTCLGDRRCDRFREKGWLGDRIDTADDQWRQLRENLPLLCAAIVAHIVLSMLVRATSPRGENQTSPAMDASRTEAKGEGAPRSNQVVSLPMGALGRRRVIFNVLASVVFLAVIHGAHAVFPVALVCATFAIGHATKGTSLAAPSAWIMAVALIWLKERWYRAVTFEGLIWAGFGWLDERGGLYHWRLSLNLAILRIVSFNLDLHWAELDKGGRQKGLGATSQQQEPGEKQERQAMKHDPDPYEPETRISAHRPLSEYSLWHCLSYVFYVPLYLAGPTITFNSYVSHMACPQQSHGGLRLVTYFGRVLFSLLLLEYGLHTLPVFALARSNILGFGPGGLTALVYVILKLMWLKFLVIWRLFRFWALCDGVEPPENMQKCMSNNYSVSNFWRGWHCSFNRWLVRYIYVPLGGSKPGRRWNVFVVFLFVALWHDVEAKLFLWGLLNGAFLLLEILVKAFYQRSRLFETCRSKALVNRMLQGLGATSNVMALFLVNLIGYTVGIDGTRDLLDNIFLARDGQIAIGVSFMVLFSGVQIMFAIEESRSGRKVTRTGYSKVATS